MFLCSTGNIVAQLVGSPLHGKRLRLGWEIGDTVQLDRVFLTAKIVYSLTLAGPVYTSPGKQAIKGQSVPDQRYICVTSLCVKEKRRSKAVFRTV